MSNNKVSKADLQELYDNFKDQQEVLNFWTDKVYKPWEQDGVPQGLAMHANKSNLTFHM